MDTLYFIADGASKLDNFGFSTLITIIKDIVTIIAILVGIYYGRKGLKRFLLDDIIKNKISNLHKANQDVFKITNQIITEISNLEDLNHPAKDDDLSIIKSFTQKLVDFSNGASKEVASLAYFLNETIRNITPNVKSKTYSEIRMASDFYALVYNTCAQLNRFSSYIVDLPKRIKLEPYNEINKSLHKYLTSEETYKIKGFQFGINMNANSPLSLLFSSILSKSTTGYIFNKKYFQLIQSNSPIIYGLFVNKIYFPVLLETEEEKPFMGKSTLHLIKFDVQQSVSPDNKKFTIEFFYSNLNPIIKFVESIKPDEISKIYDDVFIREISVFKSLSFKVYILADETLKIVCDKSEAELYYKRIKKELRRKLKNLKETTNK